MTLAIMQPYIFPYLGYYQLVNAVDTFVFFDDVNFIKKGWINRNQLLQQDQALKFTIPLLNASQNRVINEIELSDFGKWRKYFLRSVELNYKKAPHFVFVFDWLNEFFLKDYLFISDLASESVKSVSKLLELQTRFEYSSTLNYKNTNEQNGEQKILKICKILGADKYINPKNGKELYNTQQFDASNIQLNFINMGEVVYTQYKKDKFVPALSIIDILMFNSIQETNELLAKFNLN
ncbi:MAG: WbqC family protein [Ginsengibacter sp.]